MPASPAQIEANRRNSLKSTGPTSEDGKSRSRANSLKHGMTGSGIVLPREDAAEVDRLTEAFRAELKPAGEAGAVLVRRMAVHAVRMERAVVQETAALSGRVREATDAFMASSDRYAGNARALRADAANRALFDDSKGAILARKYEAASERGFHQALKEVRRMRAEADTAAVEEAAIAAAVARAVEEASEPTGQLASFFQAPPAPIPAPPTPSRVAWGPAPEGHCDIPMAIGRAR
ncbi:hypothetical protein TA3x_000177 [Tundrisphaera sp. TA3]|uniref:hypothetical protein n=1 Tax=Tundrisphaera sp. TA3 TaxID=3435775 RepID=UPI003EC09A7A